MQMKKLNYRFKINLINIKKDKFNKLNNKKINIIDIHSNFKKPCDKISDNSNAYIKKCFVLSLKKKKKNKCSGFINGPISKKNFLKQKFLGITEYLGHKVGKKNKVVMLIYNKKLAVSPITTHLPIKDIHKHISKKYLLKKKYKVTGPFPADTIFLKNQLKKYDVIIGMYHDQVLAPIKTLFGFDAINITLGLPYIRITPDHGPNSSMQGKNLSDPKSLIEALKFLDK